jgi:hypothetical protein
LSYETARNKVPKVNQLATIFNIHQTKATSHVFCHGFNGFKLGRIQLDGGLLFFCKGFNLLNFSHNGTSRTSFELDLEALNNNFKETQKISGLCWVHLKTKVLPIVDFEKLFLIGHSKGGSSSAYTLSHPEIVSCASLAVRPGSSLKTER